MFINIETASGQCFIFVAPNLARLTIESNRVKKVNARRWQGTVAAMTIISSAYIYSAYIQSALNWRFVLNVVSFCKIIVQ